MKDVRYLFSMRSLPLGIFLTVILFIFWRHLSLSYPSNISALFSNLLALLSIFSGFVASFYFFVASRGNTFLEVIQKTSTFDSLLKLTKVALELSFLSIVYVFILAGYAPVAKSVKWWEIDAVNVSAALCFLMTGVTVSNFVRCMRLFLKLTNPPK